MKQDLIKLLESYPGRCAHDKRLAIWADDIAPHIPELLEIVRAHKKDICPECNGRGFLGIPGQTCHYCFGSGVFSIKTNPPGVKCPKHTTGSGPCYCPGSGANPPGENDER